MAALRLDDLLSLAPDALARLYAQASVPRFTDVEGDLRGRMLAWQDVRGVPGQLLKAFASADFFPWRGKSFHALTPQSGEGINRVFTDGNRWFRFTTFVARSRAGDFDAVQLDYDHPENPFFIRAVKDEIRELHPGLYLGQAYLHTERSERLVLYFALAHA